MIVCKLVPNARQGKHEQEINIVIKHCGLDDRVGRPTYLSSAFILPATNGSYSYSLHLVESRRRGNWELSN